MDNESEIIELINKTEELNESENEIDPFASEKEEEFSESEFADSYESIDSAGDKCDEGEDSVASCDISDTEEGMSDAQESISDCTGYNSDTTSDTSGITDTGTSTANNCDGIPSNRTHFKICVPMISSSEILVEIRVPFTISELFEKLKEENGAIFDSNGKFIGRIYCNKQLINTTESHVIDNISTDLVLIHNLVSENDDQIVEDEIVKKKQSSKTTLMSKFKNLWVTKEKVSVTAVGLENMKISAKTGIPEFIEDVLTYLKRPEMVQEGLFRLSGTFTRIKNLQDRLNGGESFNNLNLTSTDCHNVTSLLKQFLRNLPEPLLTFGLYETWQSLGDWTDKPEIAIKISNFLINQLPELNKKILMNLMKFLNERLKDSEVTRMNSCNYGTVIGPNLLWNPQEDRQMRNSTTLGLSLQSSTLASQICTLFLQNYDEIFTEVHGCDDPVMAYGKVVYDYADCEGEGCDSDCGCAGGSADTCNTPSPSPSRSPSSTQSPSPTTLTAGQIIFISKIDDSFDGWWLGYISHQLAKFPSNYVQIISQRSDDELIN